MKKRSAVTLGILLFASALVAQPAPPGPGAGQPAPPRSPEVLSDGKVVFRLLAPAATSVTLGGDFPIGTSVAMTKDDAGVWSATVGPLEADFYGYFFTVDGVRTLDWRNVFVMRDGARHASWLRVPGPEAADYQVDDVPHGTVSQVWYPSPALGMKRRAYVYTPPGYEAGSTRYPVLYLLHGGGGDEAAWTELGRAPQVLDNLIAQGRSRPMIVVMTNGNGTQTASQSFVPLLAPPARPGEGMLRFPESLVKDVIPFVDASYRTQADRENRALAGLSMGGAQALYAGFNNLDHFAWLGAMSGGFPLLPGVAIDIPAPANAATLRGPDVTRSIDPGKYLALHPALDAGVNARLRLLYLSIGVDDGLITTHAAMKKLLEDRGVKYTLLEVRGYGHEWRFWRLSLRDLLPRLFQSPPGAAGATVGARGATRACSELASVDLGDVGGAGSRVTSATVASNRGRAVCAVEGVLAPAIGFEVQLPVQAWTGRYLQVGCGGLCGRVSLEVGAADGCAPLEAGGFAIASTDMGHQGAGGEFGRDPRKRADFAHRAVHLTAVASKKLVRAFYGRDAAHAYFTGCSDGGREALVEAQRYPGDFDGIVAGAPAMNFQVQNSLFHGWQARSNTGEDGKPILAASRLPLLHRAALDRCDGRDGHVDGLIADPRACRFDPGVLRCPSGPPADAAGCLTAAEVEAVRRLYDGPRDAATGERLTIGGPQPGSELAWAGVFVPRSAGQPIFSERIALDALRNLVFEPNPPGDFGLKDVRFDRATFDRLRPLHPLYDATDPDLSAFAARGGKLIVWHGWSDPHISPINTIAYHEAVERTMGRERAAGFERLYLLPGVYHCSGGEGPSLVDMLTPVIDWVERGVAPDAVTARSPGRSRPVYPHPSVAKHDGEGDPNLASSYARAAPLFSAGSPDWAGSDFYRPYAGRGPYRPLPGLAPCPPKCCPTRSAIPSATTRRRLPAIAWPR